MATTGTGSSILATAAVGTTTLRQLVSRLRYALEDTLEPYLWSNDELTSYVDTIQRQICAELSLVTDRATPQICTVSVVSGDGEINVDQRIISIKYAKLDSNRSKMTVGTAEQMDNQYPGWDQGAYDGSENPWILVFGGVAPGKAFIHPPTTRTTDTLRLTVVRFPLDVLDWETHADTYLDVDPYVHLLDNAILSQAYLKHDSDAFDQKKSDYHRMLWERGADGRGGDKEQIKRLKMRYNTEPNPFVGSVVV